MRTETDHDGELERLYTIAEAAQILNMSRRAVLDTIHENPGLLGEIRIGRHYRLRAGFLASQALAKADRQREPGEPRPTRMTEVKVSELDGTHAWPASGDPGSCWLCSECGHYVVLDADEHPYYCPMCGVKIETIAVWTKDPLP